MIIASAHIWYSLLWSPHACSWLVLRSQLKDEPSPGKGHSCSPPANPAGLMSAEEWCGDADDWGRCELILVACAM